MELIVHRIWVLGPPPHPFVWAFLRFLGLFRCLLLVLFLRILLPLLFLLLAPLFLAPFLFLLPGCKCRYSATKTRKILFRSLIRLKSREFALSPILCQAFGNGTEMRWRIGTPLLLKGMWSSSMPDGILAASLKIVFPETLLVDLLKFLSMDTSRSYQSPVEDSNFMKDMSPAPMRSRRTNISILSR